MSVGWKVFAALALVAALATSPAVAQRPAAGPVALVVGEARYPESDAPPPTTVEDARAVAEELRRLGFAVTFGENLAKSALTEAVDKFLADIKPGSVAAVYFGGYAIQSARQNYLIPVDSQIWTEADIGRNGLPLARLLSEIDGRGASTTFVMLDAAYRNPFERRFRSFSTGLAPIATLAQSAALVFSSAPGSVLRPGTGSRSPFTAELLRQVSAAGGLSPDVFARTSQAVSDASGNDQSPWVFSSVREPAKVASVPTPAPAPPSPAVSPETPKTAALPPPTLRPAPQPPAPPPVVAAPPAAAPPPVAAPPPDTRARPAAPAQTASRPPESLDEADFQGVQRTGTREAYEEFIRRHRPSRLTEAARAEIARMDAARPVRQALPYSPADDKVKADLAAAIGKNSDDVVAYYTRGQLYALHYDFEKAAADFDQVLRIAPQDVEALNNRCWVRAILDQLDGALADCNAALAGRPGFLDALDSRGFLNLKIGMPNRAIADYDAALRVNNRHASALYGRGVARVRLGEPARGNGDIRTALAIDPNIANEFAMFGVR